MRILLGFFGLFFSSYALAAQNLVLVNHANLTVACAVGHWDGASVNVNNWYVVTNGVSASLGAADYLYCEQLGGGRYWFANSPGVRACVSGGVYTNPIFAANRPEFCEQIAGRMVQFRAIPGNTTFTEYLNP